MKKVKLDEAIDRRLQRSDRARGFGREHAQLSRRKPLLQPPQGRERGGEIADMVELEGDDAAHPLARDQRLRGMDHLDRLGIGYIRVGVGEKTGVEERIAE